MKIIIFFTYSDVLSAGIEQWPSIQQNKNKKIKDNLAWYEEEEEGHFVFSYSTYLWVAG